MYGVGVGVGVGMGVLISVWGGCRDGYSNGCIRCVYGWV